MAAGGEEGTASGVFASVPAELSVPGSDAVVIIDFAIVQFAEQSLVDDGFGGEELAGIAAFEADAGFYLRLLHGFLHVAQIFG